jgi:hypothetical protein
MVAALDFELCSEEIDQSICIALDYSRDTEDLWHILGVYDDEIGSDGRLAVCESIERVNYAIG